MTALRIVPVAIVALVLAALAWRIAVPPDPVIESELVGKPAPGFNAEPAIPGKPGFTAAGLADGRAKLVNVFASWCVPCIAEAPVLMELKRRGVPILGIAVRDRPEDVERFLARHGDPFAAMIADPESKVQLAFGSAGVPETFVIDGDGVVTMQHVGAIEAEDLPDILRAVEAAR